MRRTIFMYTAIVVCCIASLPTFGASFMEALKETPLLDSKSLSGSEIAISTPFEISTVNTQRQAVFDLEDTLRGLAAKGDSFINDTRAINIFAKLNQLAFQANYYAIGFFIRLFQDGTIGGRALPELSKQPERAALFILIKELCADLLDAKEQTEEERILRNINALLTKHILYDCLLTLEQKDSEEYNDIISKIIETLVSKLGKSRAVLAEKFGISKSAVHRIYHKQALGTRASSPRNVGRVLTAKAAMLREFLGLTEEEYHQFVNELYLLTPARSDSQAESGLRSRCESSTSCV